MPQNVPEPFKEPLEALGKFTDDQMKRVLSTLEPQRYIASRTTVRDALFSAVPSTSMRSTLRELSAFLMALTRLSATQGDKKEGIKNFASGPNLNLTDEERDRLMERLLALVSLPGMLFAAQAGHEERNHERLLTESSIETDFRPLLGEDGKIALVIPWHTLNLRYTSRQFEEDQSESIVLDHSDLVSLRKQIDAALETRLRLQGDMENRDINVWEPYIPEKPELSNKES